MTAAVLETSIIDHITASEKYRLETFSSLLTFPYITRHQLALAGFIYRSLQCLCPQCGIKIDLNSLRSDHIYPSNHFRKLHRSKVSHLGKRCAFLLCEPGANIDDLHPPLSSVSGKNRQWDDAEHPEFSDYNKCFETFNTWPHLKQSVNTFVTPALMATHGFFFSGPEDGVTCFFCGNTLKDWSQILDDENKDIVRIEHARFFPCRFITCIVGGKFVAEAGYFYVVSDQERRRRNPMTSENIVLTNKPQSIDECLSTFENWPSSAPLLAKDLALTGFYYLGENLCVKCYMCDLEVDDWHRGMTAYGTHKRRQPNCDIIQAIASTHTGDVQSVNEKWRLQTLDGLSFGNDSDPNLCRKLAACGFYRFRNTNYIRCAYCGVTIEPKTDRSIMSQHRALAKQLKKSTYIDCLMVRAQCPSNVPIPDREPFPEYSEFQSVFERRNTFEAYKQRHKVTDSFIRERVEAGFFLDTMKLMRCFQCGNSLPIKDKRMYDKFPEYNIEKIHAHFYPTCEWVKQILGIKYIKQVLYDRLKLNESEYQLVYSGQTSSSSSLVNPTTLRSFSSISMGSDSIDRRLSTQLNASDYSGESDDEGYETVASPFKSQYIDRIPSMPSAPESPSQASQMTTAAPQTCIDSINNDIHGHYSSPILDDRKNPFQIQSSEQNSSSIESTHVGTSPADPRASLAYESNRLLSFKLHRYERFADFNIEELAYAGFYMNAEGTAVKCPWCVIELTEQRVLSITKQKPIIPGSLLNDDPWTAMRVHRHESGQYLGKKYSWCLWIRREYGELYPNVVRNESKMRYPEYPSYSTTEKRIETFQSDWNYPSGSLLSNVAMANAGFINLGEGTVCCFYCGNRMCDFEPRDCPFEEHAVFHPLCDYIIEKRGTDYVERVVRESLRRVAAKQKIEIYGSLILKTVIFEKTGMSPSKNSRVPAKRLGSRSSASTSRSISRSTTASSDITENSCQLCFDNPAIYEYDPCHHGQMCGECFAKLTKHQLEECFYCYRPAKIHLR